MKFVRIALLSVLTCTQISCITQYSGVADNVPFAQIEFLRNEKGTKEKGDPLQGYNLVGKNECDSGESLARFSFDKDFKKTQKVPANEPLEIIMHSVFGDNFNNFCNSYVKFTPVVGKEYTISHLGIPNAKNCRPYVVDNSNLNPPNDLVVKLNSELNCKSW